MPKSKLQKQEEAKQRQIQRNKRSIKDQLSHLDSIFGKDKAAQKERKKLNALLEKQSDSNCEEEPKDLDKKTKTKKSKAKKTKN